MRDVAQGSTRANTDRFEPSANWDRGNPSFHRTFRREPFRRHKWRGVGIGLAELVAIAVLGAVTRVLLQEKKGASTLSLTADDATLFCIFAALSHIQVSTAALFTHASAGTDSRGEENVSVEDALPSLTAAAASFFTGTTGV